MERLYDRQSADVGLRGFGARRWVVLYLTAFFVMTVQATIGVQAQSLCINEIMVANVDLFVDPSYNYGGWVEVYNPTSDVLSLNNYFLRHTDAEGKVKQSKLTTGHGTVAPLGYAVLWFDHNSSDGYYGSYAGTQIPFKLDADGGLLELLDSKGHVVDAVCYPKCISRCSWMRQTDGDATFGWTSRATPGASNNASPI
ncbi:MAG: lamin tail domain-containing protein, partial [Bacteroidales bacterium]|nr:lamin tail domain-containing protein [Bacteroidales bacterium]